MSYPINYPTPQGANVQIFRGGDQGTTAHVYTRDWVKPQGASFVWFTLIGAGGGGGGGMLDSVTPVDYYGGGGASGNVTNFMCPAFLLPDVLQVAVGKGGVGGSQGTDTAGTDGLSGEQTQIFYQQKNNTGYQLLLASGGGGGAGANFSDGGGGNATGANTGGPMTAAGFFNSTNGQVGKNGGMFNFASVDNLTFLMSGSGTNNGAGTITGYYGYTASNTTGYSQISPIIMAIAGSPARGTGSRVTPSAFGCGGNGGISTNNGSTGGDGLAIIVTW